MLTGISLVCFSTSYAITPALEVSRLFFRMPIRMVVMLMFAVVGLVTQGLYLYNRATDPALASVPLSNWHDWYVIAALVLAFSTFTWRRRARRLPSACSCCRWCWC